VHPKCRLSVKADTIIMTGGYPEGGVSVARKRAREAMIDDMVGAPDDFDLLEDPEFLAHFEDAQLRSALLRQLLDTRNAVGLTQAEIAAVMCTTQSAISELESGAIDPRVSTLQRYARAVGSQLYAHLRESGAQDVWISFVQQAAEALRPLGEAAAALRPPTIVIEGLVTAGRNDVDLIGEGPPMKPVEDVLISDIYGKVA
jgi:transcriptional regulator with XRE-family HTH domain